ncbi:sterol desaturase family protein [Algoriphagus pacificus]|uniref:Sterol desaturase family protein n=1 Tax=Algoriphagus pacificus TaxID=2811234 RepID=A0ABS3CJ72_9BACT|nr:sterol desaturase family protein [Algoriphagus pacificus]MBN7816536.1 sterol desaturase family protein [Algoriphagus pacificus]
MKTQSTPSAFSLKKCTYIAAIIFIGLLLLCHLFKANTYLFFTGLFGIGWLLWTFTEYFLHRFVMHEFLILRSSSNIIDHHNHHKSPQNLKVKAIHRITFLMFFLIVLKLSIQYGGYSPLIAGFLFGITTYNFLHYLLHQPIGNSLFPSIQRAHILHHYNRPNHGYSFSTSFWDRLFKTYPPKEDQITEQMLSKYFSKSSNSNFKLTETMKSHSNIFSLLLIIVLLLILTNACVPVFSDMQSARTLGKGNFEVTPFYTNSAADSESKGVTQVSANLGIGLSENIDIRGRISHLWFNGEGGGGSTIFGIGPKFSMVPERLSLFIPVGSSFDVDSWQLQPTLFYTQPIVEKKFEATLSPKYIFNLCRDCSGFFATNLGIAYSKDLTKNAIRAEYGRIFSDGGGLGQFSLGYSFVLSKKNK